MAGHPRSRWLFLALALAGSAVCARLGVWQLMRHSDRHDANMGARLMRLNGFRPYPDSVTLSANVGVVMTGHFDLEHEFVLRGRAYDGAPGVEIATPFRIDGRDTAVMVVRGFVPSDDATSVDLAAIREEGERTIRGIAFRIDTTTGGGGRGERNGATTLLRLNTAPLATLPYPVSPYALWQEKDSGMAGFPIRIGAPKLEKGPHFSYMLQWFAFAIIFGVGGIIYTFRKREERGENAVP